MKVRMIHTSPMVSLCGRAEITVYLQPAVVRFLPVHHSARPHARSSQKSRAWVYSAVFHLVLVTTALLSFPILARSAADRVEYSPPLEMVVANCAPPTQSLPEFSPSAIPPPDDRQAHIEMVEVQPPDIEEVDLDLAELDIFKDHIPQESLVIVRPHADHSARILSKRPPDLKRPQPATSSPPPSAPQPLRKAGPTRAAQLVQQLTPVYPESQRQAGKTARLMMRVYLDDAGFVLRTEPLTEGLHPDFIRAARKALRQARFTPALKDGEAVKTSLLMDFEFRLRK